MLTSLDELRDLILGKPKEFDYQEYLKSEKWQEIRAVKLKEAKNRCQVCNRAYRLQVHHRTYERIGSEDLSDLTVLCATCHSIFHKNGRLNAAKKNTKSRRWKKNYTRR